MAKHDFNEEADINITPLIDILFILLLFFILTSTFDIKDEKSMDIKLPEVSTGKAVESNDLFSVSVNSENEIYHNGKIQSMDDLKKQLANYAKDRDTKTVNIVADENASHGVVMKVMDLIRAEGIFSVNIEVAQK